MTKTRIPTLANAHSVLLLQVLIVMTRPLQTEVHAHTYMPVAGSLST
jgi:hypothetical protein